jgi:hypothetical protein
VAQVDEYRRLAPDPVEQRLGALTAAPDLAQCLGRTGDEVHVHADRAVLRVVISVLGPSMIT